MADSKGESVARAASSALAEMVEEARRGVVEVRSGGRGSGAGVTWPGEGLVLTNNHVVARGRRRRGGVRVTLHDGRALEAEVVKRSRGLDLALLRLRGETGDLPTIPVGDSDALRVGELVFAIGHPWGNPGTATAGVVSGIGVPGGRSRWGGPSAGYVRSDVALAPGNSGGPLLNVRGEVVGINAMIFGRTALSIPSNAAAAWAGEPAAQGDGRPRLGVEVVPVEFPASGRPEEGDAWGLAITSVEEGGPAHAAGLLVGDVMLGLAGTGPQDVGSFGDALDGGDAVSLRVLRGGETLVVEVSPRASGRAA
jgi:serine protease Do